MKICPKVYIIERAPALRADEIMIRNVSAAPNVEVMTRTAVTEIAGNGFVTSMTVKQCRYRRSQAASRDRRVRGGRSDPEHGLQSRAWCD